jgi:hypothetical protein
MVASPAATTLYPAAESGLTDSPAARASIARYIASGERVRGLMDLMWKAALGLIVLIVLAWASGLLPGAVKLF